MGAVGGGIWHSVKGAKNSPKVKKKKKKKGVDTSIKTLF
jgi:hypothetical protein